MDPIRKNRNGTSRRDGLDGLDGLDEHRMQGINASLGSELNADRHGITAKNWMPDLAL